MQNRTRKGFTLIELLIVVVIIGILAAIAIPKFANTKEKAMVASMKSDLHNFAIAQEGYFADSNKFGTQAQLELAQSDTYCPVDVHFLDGCGHSPQIDQPQATLTAITEFSSRILEMHEGLAPAA